MLNPTHDFSGQVALVTGAARGVGLAAARMFAAGGAALALLDVDGARALREAERVAAEGGRAIGLAWDVTDEAQVASAIDRVVAVNPRGLWACTKHALRVMHAHGSSAIVNNSSLGGLVGLSQHAAYYGSKHAVLGMRKNAAVEYASRGIRINAVCPGTIDTPMVQDMLAGQADMMQEIMCDQPIGRLGRAEDIAVAVLWLCRSGASFVVGVCQPVDGGFTAH